jgi:hypothetical protein
MPPKCTAVLSSEPTAAGQLEEVAAAVENVECGDSEPQFFLFLPRYLSHRSWKSGYLSHGQDTHRTVPDVAAFALVGRSKRDD